jgi:hypothetical protein
MTTEEALPDKPALLEASNSATVVRISNQPNSPKSENGESVFGHKPNCFSTVAVAPKLFPPNRHSEFCTTVKPVDPYQSYFADWAMSRRF